MKIYFQEDKAVLVPNTRVGESHKILSSAIILSLFSTRKKKSLHGLENKRYY